MALLGGILPWWLLHASDRQRADWWGGSLGWIFGLPGHLSDDVARTSNFRTYTGDGSAERGTAEVERL